MNDLKDLKRVLQARLEAVLTELERACSEPIPETDRALRIYVQRTGYLQGRADAVSACLGDCSRMIERATAAKMDLVPVLVTNQTPDADYCYRHEHGNCPCADL